MSSVFAGYANQETKPGKPRIDIKPGTDGNVPVNWSFEYKYYNDIAFVGNFNVAIAIGDNVDLTKPQTIYSAIGYLRAYLLENLSQLAQDPTERLGAILALGQHQVKSQTVVSTGVPDSNFNEVDLDQDKVSLVFFIQPVGSARMGVGSGIFYSCIQRLREMAREAVYFTVGEPRRGATTVPDQSVAVGATATFTAPSFNDGGDGVGGPVINAWWIENGILMRPLRDGTASLVLTAVTAEMNGNVYQVRASSGPAYRHSATGLLTVT